MTFGGEKILKHIASYSITPEMELGSQDGMDEQGLNVFDTNSHALVVREVLRCNSQTDMSFCMHVCLFMVGTGD